MSRVELSNEDRDRYHARMMNKLPDGLAFKENMKLCGKPRLTSDNKFKCRKVGCPKCRYSYISREQKNAINRYEHASAFDMALLTINLGIVAETDAIWDRWVADRKKMRYAIRALAQRRTPWLHLSMTAYLDVFPFAYEEVTSLGVKQKEYIASVGLPASDHIRPYWMYHLHALVHHPRLDWQAVRDGLANHFSAPHQVHVEPLYRDELKGDNISSVIAYANKYQPVSLIKGCERDWSSEWMADYFYSCECFSDSYKSIRMQINGKILPVALGDLLREDK